jgi:peptidoglycan/xylan/chitin deacetylase (PgdA/CDA1 family)
MVGLVAGGLVAGSFAAVAPVQAAPRNLVSNASAETLSRGVPSGWSKAGGGVNTRTLSVRSGGAKSGSRFVRAAITKYSSGGAWWVSPPVSARAGTVYTYTDYYRSNATTRIDVAITVKGKISWKRLGSLKPATGWTASKVVLTAPAGATKVSFVHVLASVGSLDIDTVGVTASTAKPPATATPTVAPITTTTTTTTAPSTTTSTTTKPPVTTTTSSSKPVTVSSGKGLVSVTFDDGWANQYDNALPLLKQNGVPGTFYLISGYLNASQYMTVAQAKQVQAAGNEIGSHTINHPNLTTLSGSELTAQLADSKAALEANFGAIYDLAYPYGAFNGSVQTEAAKYYSSARSTNGGTNPRGSISRYALTIGYVFNTTSTDTIKGWIADAQAKNTWLILCYHGIADGKPGDTYTTSVADFGTAMAAIKSSGIQAVTVHEGVGLTAS